MAGKSVIGPDSRAQIAAIHLSESAANTLTVALFNFPFSIMDKMALNIHRLEYWPDYASLVGTGDTITMAVICGKSISDIKDQTDPIMVDSFRIQRWDSGTAANANIAVAPYVKNFTQLPGGGLLVPPNPLAFAIKGDSLAAAGAAILRMHYTYLELPTDEYWQLVESRRVISNS